MNELSLSAINDSIMSLNHNVSKIINQAHAQINQHLDQNGITLSNINSEYLNKNQHNDKIMVNNLFVKELKLNGQPLFDGDVISYGSNSLSLSNELLVNNEQVLLKNDTCLTLCYEGIYSAYLLSNKSEIVISGLYQESNIGDLIIPVSILEKNSTTTVGNGSFAVLIKCADDECSIEPGNQQSVITNVIMR
jgi:hypothetical protein|nr:MAG TPA: hypothetical protein [Caudoviricetes sp.]